VFDGSDANSSASFWQRALESLPPEIRWRYALDFEAAERYERMLDSAIALCKSGGRLLARGIAQALHRSAWILELAARRVS